MGQHKKLLLLLFLACFPFLSNSAESKTYKICSYNVQNFNISKLDGPRILRLLTKVLSMCDVCLLQEVRDLDGEAMKKLVSSLNGYNGHQYDYVVSGGLGGPDDVKEQYAFLYRKRTTGVVKTHQYPEEKKGTERVFNREPFVVHFNASTTVIGQFVLIPLRAQPQRALAELDALYDVVTQIKAKWKVENIMILGDFHADCGYVTRKNRKDNRLFKSLDLFWLIRDDADTTVTDMTDCAYDRFVVHGETFLRAITPLSAEVFNFKKKFKTSMHEVLTISDHYPITVDLKLKSSGQPQALLMPLLLLLPLIALLHFPA